MHLLSQFQSVCAAIALACAVPASAGVINFDGTGAPITLAQATPLSSYYAAQGVRFAGVSGAGGSILNDGAEYGFTARSGSDFLAFLLDDGSGLANASGPDERISFASEQSRVSIFAATIEDQGFTMSAFDGIGNLLGSTSVAGNRDWQELTLAFSGIRSVVVSSSAYAWALDDLDFSASAEVPEPGSLALLGAGLLGGLAARRKRAIAGK